MGDDLPDEQRCHRNDGRKWRCRRPVVEGRTLCEAHFLQGRLRQNREPVPETLKLDRQRTPRNQESPRVTSSSRKRSQIESENSSNLSRKRLKKEAKLKSPVDVSEDLDDALKKMNLKKGDLRLDLIRGCLNRQIEKKKKKKKGKGKVKEKEDVVKELKYGRLEISQSSTSTPPPQPLTLNNVKIGLPPSSSLPTRFFRSKNIDRFPLPTIQVASFSYTFFRNCYYV